jgi:hypothetical protein
MIRFVSSQVCRVDNRSIGEDLCELSSDNLVLLSTFRSHLLPELVSSVSLQHSQTHPIAVSACSTFHVNGEPLGDM